MKKLVILIFGAFAVATSAQAATFDFLTLSNAPNAEKGGNPLVFMDSGVTLTATGYASENGTYVGGPLHNTDFGAGDDFFAYLDGGAGLGVCKQLNDNLQCDPSSDDNVTVKEVLKLVLEGANQIKDLSFLNAGHQSVDPDADIAYRIGGAGNYQDSTFGALSMMTLVGNIFEFKIGDNPQSDNDQFYISSLTAVPVPAAVWLFGTALIGFVGMSRRVKVG